MSMIREQQIETKIARANWSHANNPQLRFGADEVAGEICEQLGSGAIAWNDLPPVQRLARLFVRDKRTGLPLDLRDRMVQEDMTRWKNISQHFDSCMIRSPNGDLANGYVTEQAAAFIKEEATSTATTMGSFMALVSQLYFNALIGAYEHADMNVARTFRNIPSTFLRGEKFAGVGGLEKILQGTPEGRDLPHLTATEDYVDTPAQRKVGAIVDISWELATGDHSGEIMRRFESLGKAVAVTREMEAVGTLMDVDPNTGAAGYNRTRYNWKQTSYATYYGNSGTNPWVNLLTGGASGAYYGANPLVNQQSINAAYVTATRITDPWTGLPISYGEGPWTLFCAPDLKFTAARIARSTQFRTSATASNAASTNQTPLMVSDGATVIEFDIVASAYIGALMDFASISRQTWWIGKPSEAFSWQTAQELVTQEALPGAGDMFNRVLEKQSRCFDCKSAFALNPRFVLQNNPT